MIRGGYAEPFDKPESRARKNRVLSHQKSYAAAIPSKKQRDQLEADFIQYLIKE
jgi:hypothetical protein